MSCMSSTLSVLHSCYMISECRVSHTLYRDLIWSDADWFSGRDESRNRLFLLIKRERVSDAFRGIFNIRA